MNFQDSQGLSLPWDLLSDACPVEGVYGLGGEMEPELKTGETSGGSSDTTKGRAGIVRNFCCYTGDILR